MAKVGDKWIQAAIPAANKGKLRKKLGVKSGEKIPKSKLEKAAKKPGALGKESRLAETLKKLNHKRKGK